MRFSLTKLQKSLILLALFVLFGWLTLFDKPSIHSISQAEIIPVNISQDRLIHILYGNTSSGGHLYGAGKPCKSEFPKEWDKEKVIQSITLVATNDNLDWKKQNNGYFVADQNIDGIKIRVVKGRQKKEVITAYPLNTPRNYCPRPANDN